MGLDLAENVYPLESVKVFPIQKTVFLEIVGGHEIIHRSIAPRETQVMLLGGSNVFPEDIIVVNVVISLRICSSPLLSDRNGIVGYDTVLVILDSLEAGCGDVVSIAVVMCSLIEIQRPGIGICR